MSENTRIKLKGELKMTREEMVTKLAELETSANEKVKLYNEAYQDGRLKDSADINTDLDKIIDEYAGIARSLTYWDCKEAEDPMRFAVEKLTYEIISTKDEKREGVSVLVRTIVKKDKAIDLRNLHEFLNGIGKDTKWIWMVEKLNCLLTAQKAVDLGINPKEVNDSFAMADIAKEIDLGKTPTSRTNLLRTLNMVVTAMIGKEFKATSHDVAYLMTVYAKKNRKALTVTCANHKALTGIMAEICHRIILDKTYAVDYKKKA